MPKTDLLNLIESTSQELGRRLNILFVTIEEQAEEQHPQMLVLKRLLDEAGPVKDKMNEAVRKLQAKIDGWPTDNKLKNKFKDQQQLALDRKTAENYFNLTLKPQVKLINELYEQTSKSYIRLKAVVDRFAQMNNNNNNNAGGGNAGGGNAGGGNAVVVNRARN